MAIVVPSVILICGLINDLKSQKVRNQLVIALAVFAVASTYFLYGFSGLKMAGLSAAFAFVLCFPLFISKVIGGGDLKLMVAFGFSVAPMVSFWVLVYSLFWGGLLGLIRALLDKKGIHVFQNMLSVVTRTPVEEKQLHKIPYTVALLFGWLTQQSLNGFIGAGL